MLSKILEREQKEEAYKEVIFWLTMCVISLAVFLVTIVGF